ncbi:MAG TPA: GNAT family N-acetyltransferase, partial [Pyrinomonadaceae bacterium]
FVNLPEGENKEKLIEDYVKGFSKNRRQTLGKKLRRLQALGNVEFSVTRGYSAELMQKYFALEEQSWKARAGTAVTSDEKAARLHDDFARAVAERNALFIYELKLDGKTIAMYISIMYDRQTVGWKMSFDEEYARFSPGNLLLLEVLKGCIENDSPELDMLSPATDNKKFWATGEREHVAFYIFRRGIIGSMLWKWKFSVISRLRNFKRKTPLKAAS